MPKTANALNVAEEEVDMDERTAVLTADVAHIKNTLIEIKTDFRELRGKLDAANNAIYELRNDLTKTAAELRSDFTTANAGLRNDLTSALAKLQNELTLTRGEFHIALEKAVGTLQAAIERNSGEHRATGWQTRVWFLLLLGSVLGGALIFIARALQWF